MANFGSTAYHAATSTGTRVTTASSSATATLPVDQSGATARLCYFAVSSSNTGDGAHIRLITESNSASLATNTDFLLMGTAPMVLWTRGYSRAAFVLEGHAAILTISPIEDG